jgi:hypothetical protein
VLLVQQTGWAELQETSASKTANECMYIGSPRASTKADGGDGAAGDSDLASERANNNAQETEEGCDGRGVGRLDAVAALERSSVALIAGRRAAVIATSGRGSSKGCNGEGSKSGELELHDC